MDLPIMFLCAARSSMNGCAVWICAHLHEIALSHFFFSFQNGIILIERVFVNFIQFMVPGKAKRDETNRSHRLLTHSRDIRCEY